MNWISAFECLIHPGPEQRVRLSDIYDHLEAINWTNNECASPTCPAYPAGPPKDLEFCLVGFTASCTMLEMTSPTEIPVDANR